MTVLSKKMAFLAISLLFSLAITQTSFAIVSRDNMMHIAESYKNYIWTPTEDNICHNKCCVKWNEKGKCTKEIACIVNTPDRNTYKTWTEERGWKAEKEKDENGEETDVWKSVTSVSYQRGGCSSIEINGFDLKEMKGFGDFEEGVESRKCAGDARGSGNVDRHAVGIDCSGFVSRSWNLNPRESTWSLPKISRKLNKYDDLTKGDLLNVKGSHAMLFKEFLDSKIPHEDLRVSEAMGYYWKVRNSDYDIAELRDVKKYKPYAYFKTMDVDLVIDRSGSMQGFPMLFAKSAAKQFVDYMQTGHKIGVVSFADDAAINYPLTEIEESRPSVVKWEIRNAIDSIQAWGMTSIGAGLERGHSQLETLGIENSEKAIILMSDGWENTPPWVADVIEGIIDDKIKVCTVGLGFNSDMELLNNLAKQTGCVYKFAATSEALQEIYQDLWSEISGEDTIVKIKSKIEPLETITKSVYLDSSMHSATFSLSWPGSDIDLTLFDPDGKEINHNIDDPDIEFIEGDTYEFYRIENPTHGQWQLEFYGKDIPAELPEGENFVFTLSGINGLIFEANLDKPEYIQGEEIIVVAFAQDPVIDSNDPQYVSNASFEVSIVNPSQTTSTLQLYDDGNHNDGGADDGVYANTFRNTQISGSYIFNIKASGNTNRAGDPFTREKSVSTFVAENQLPVMEAKSIKERVRKNLEGAKTEDEEIDEEINKKIDDVIKSITKALQDDLWQDETHLDSKQENEVFVYEMTAIARMELYLYQQELPEDVPAVFEQAIENLVKADKTLAQVILYDAKNTFVENEKSREKFEELITKAEEEMERALEHENDNPVEAVKYYWQSWKYSQGAIQEAGK